MVSIKKSSLIQSPIIINSPHANVNSKSGNTSKKKNTKIYYIAAVATLIMLGIMFLTYFGFTGDKMFNKEINDLPKVNIQDSDLDRSPVIVDSPGALVDNSVTVNKILPEIIIEKGSYNDMGLIDGMFKIRINFEYIIMAIFGMKHNIEYIEAIIYDGDNLLGNYKLANSTTPNFNFMRSERSYGFTAVTKIKISDPKIQLTMFVNGERVKTSIYDLGLA